MRAVLANRKVWIWAAVWLFTRGLILSHVGFWNDSTGIQAEDVSIFGVWSEQLGVHHMLPNEEAWQYPPGAALLMVCRGSAAVTSSTTSWRRCWSST